VQGTGARASDSSALSPQDEAKLKACYVAVWGGGEDKRAFLSYFDSEACEPVEDDDLDFLEVSNHLVSERRSMILFNLPPTTPCGGELGKYLSRICHAHLLIGMAQDFENKLRTQISSNHGEGILFRLERGPGQVCPSARISDAREEPNTRTRSRSSAQATPRSGSQGSGNSPPAWGQAPVKPGHRPRNSQSGEVEADPTSSSRPERTLSQLSKAQLDPDARLPLAAQQGKKAGSQTPPVSPTARTPPKTLWTPTNMTTALQVLRSIYQTLEENGFLDREPEEPIPEIFAAQASQDAEKGPERRGGCC